MESKQQLLSLLDARAALESRAESPRASRQTLATAKFERLRTLARFCLSLNPSVAFQSFTALPATLHSQIPLRNRITAMTSSEVPNQPKPLHVAALVAAMASTVLAPLGAFAEDATVTGWPDWAPEWLVSFGQTPEGKQLLVKAGEALIDAAIPGAALFVFFGYTGFIASKILSREKKERELPPALAKALGITKEPEEFLKIERLNEKLESFDYSLTKATMSPEAALRQKEKLSLQRRLGKELASFDLGAKAVRNIQKDLEKYRMEDTKLKDKLEKKLQTMRAKPFENAAQKGAKKEEQKVNESSISATAEDTNTSKGLGVLLPVGGKTKKDEKEIQQIQMSRLRLEQAFLRSVSNSLPPENAAAFAAAIKPSQPLSSAEPGGGGLSAFDSLEDIAAAARAQSKHVWVLKFFGDITASQVKNLRQEITATLRTANASRGDEVLLVLNTGGGTVTGYGLAAAQLSRLKQAGLHLTICVEQVAASGGYLMACVADKILAGPFAVLGSIGVITEIPNVYERLTKEGVVFNTVTAGKYKRTLTPTKKFDEKDLKKTKDDIEQVLVIFKGFVHKNRPKLDIDKVATGETWIGPDALANDLVDGLVTVDEVLSDHVSNGAEVFSISYSEKKPAGALGALSLPGGALGGDLPSSFDFSWRGLALGLLSRAFMPQRAAGGMEDPWLRNAFMGAAASLPEDVPAVSGTEAFERRAMLQRPRGEAKPQLYWRGEEDPGDTWSF